MSTTEYVSVFVAIIIGLAVADLLFSLHRLLRAGSRVKWDWLTPALALLMLLLTVTFWWVTHGWYGRIHSLSIGAFLPDLGVFMILFLAVAAVLPDEVPAEGLDLRAYYLGSARYVWTLIALSLAASAALIAFRFPPEPGLASWAAALGDNLLLVAAALVPVFTRRLWIHGAVIVLLLASIGYGSTLISIAS